MTGPKRAIDCKRITFHKFQSVLHAIAEELCGYSSTPRFVGVSLTMAVSKSVEKNKLLFANLDLVNPSRQRALLAHLRAVISSHAGSEPALMTRPVSQLLCAGETMTA